MGRSRSFGNLPFSDLSEILKQASEPLSRLSESKFLVVGGTGFVGTWLTSTLLHANIELNLNISLHVTTRNTQNAIRRLQTSESGSIRFLEIDFQSGQLPKDLPDFTHIFFGGTPTVPSTGSGDAQGTRMSTLRAVNQLIELARRSNTPPTFLNASSGAVYGSQSSEVKLAPEVELEETPNKDVTDYGKLKFEVEKRIREETESGYLLGTNPRLFTFYGPHLPLKEKYAAGNFMEKIVRGLHVTLSGNSETRRSYLYPTDMVTAILHLLSSPTLEPIHIGSSKIVTMAELAEKMAKLNINSRVSRDGEDNFASNYVPDNLNFRTLYPWQETVDLEDGLNRWFKWIIGS